jgi:hypothetical protein
MKSGAKAVCVIGCVLGAAGAGMSASGATEDNPYHAIVERNVFDLKPPPPPVVAPTVTNAPPPNVKLTGITTILGNKLALFMVSEPAQPGKPPSKEESMMLSEGQRQGVIEVLEINEKAASVKIKNDGNESLIALDTAPKLPSGPGAPGAAPLGQPVGPRPTFTPPLPGNNPNNPFRPATTSTSPFSPVPANNNNAGYNPSYASANNGMSTLPQRTLRTGAGIDPLQMLQQQPMAQPQQAQPTDNLSLEEKLVLTQLEKMNNQKLIEQGIPMPPIPPIPGMPAETDGQQQAQGTLDMTPPIRSGRR